TGKEIIGATLQIKDKDGNVVHEWVTDGKPHRIEYLPIDTTFILHEEYVADGYVHAEDIEFTVKETGEIQKVNMKDDYTRTIISKIDKETGELLTGADLQLYYVAKDKADVKNDSDPLAKYDLVDEWKSGNEPKLFERLKVGKYILHEKKAPYGYETAQDITFEIVETEKPLKITMEDIKIRSYVKIKKVDEDNHDKVLKGVEFTLYTDKDCTKPLMTKTTNDNGEIIFENLTYQTLYVKETKAAAGYQLSNEVVKIVINDEWLKSDKTLVFGNKLIPSVSTGDNTALPLTLGLFMLSGLCLIVCKKKMQK
ncbi:MAG: head-tail adaptor protein, partial [Erysipelotrichaceae bacterium]|nr:head-tail adaptor protein [Erysipelotrichaceae bacterium]